ncbi:MAG: alcohol dehydrogenase catalytic domain-containing protein [Cyanobacteria bacterium P01_A01_bin.17]
MKATWYEQSGKATDVLHHSATETPEPQQGKVRACIKASGVNPSDTKFRSGWMGLQQPYPRTVPHNDGAGVIDAAGAGVSSDRVGARV